jgi:hypothetical protein
MKLKIKYLTSLKKRRMEELHKKINIEISNRINID